MPTLKDIAKRSGVSTATVSYVINNGPRPVSPDTRERVLDAIRELNYRPNAAARGLKGHRTDTFGVVFPHVVADPLENSYFAPVLAGLLDTAVHRKIATMLFSGLSWAEAEEEISNYTDGRCDGLILIAAPKKSRLAPALRAMGVPFVTVGTHTGYEWETSIDVDNVEGAKLAVGHLLDLGHRRVGMIQGTATHSSNDERTAGFLAAHAERRIEPFRELIEPAAYQPDTARAAAFRALERPKGSRTTAMFCANDMLASITIDVAESLGIQVPGDLSVVGFDDYAFAATTQPPLTTVRQPLREIGARAAEMLYRQVHEPGTQPERVLMEPVLVIRNSAAPFEG